MVVADQYFSFGAGPPTRKPTKLSFLGADGDICHTGRVGDNRTFSRFPSQAISSRNSSVGDVSPLGSVVVNYERATAVTCRSHPACASLNHCQHNIPGSTAGQSNPRQFTASHSSSWAAELTIPPVPPSHSPSRWPESLKYQKFFPLSKSLADETHHYYGDIIAKIARQQFIRSQFLLQITQNTSNSQVKGIYAGFVMVENKCIEHPTANPVLRRLASKYAMPARMWRHGIHTFLELLRHNMPDYLEHMLTFIYVAYSMMALLYETVLVLEATWTKCLGSGQLQNGY
ncbi:hypothetical protein GGI43DRAFT_422820 [Trichoderma evansii]